MKPGSLRRCLSLLLVVSLLAPSTGFAHIPSTAPTPQPPAPSIRPTPAPTPPPASTSPRGVTPGADYRLAPGDVLEGQIAGRLEVIRQQAVVDLGGPSNVPPRGALPVGGLTLLQAHRKVSARAREVFKFADATITVVAPRTFEVTVSGDVERPGTVQTPATRRVYDVILDAGGITSRGSTRNVVLIRRSGGSGDRKEAMPLELRAALTPSTDLLLRPGDAIYVPTISSLQDVIEVRGAFNGTAESTKTTVAGKATILQRFELAQGERVRDV